MISLGAEMCFLHLLAASSWTKQLAIQRREGTRFHTEIQSLEITMCLHSNPSCSVGDYDWG